ncbi:MAG: coproporphyrinogen-III oxidase family protein, partial [Armatimonadota bacterium]
DLLKLGRIHTPGEVGKAVARARQAGFQRINVDLMFGLPGQRLGGWRNNLQIALGLGTDHLSLYGLTIEQNTRFHRLYHRGMLDLPDEDRQIEMYELARQLCHENGLEQYEISNFAKPGHECLHNLEYWHCEEYAGYGPGAVGCFGDRGNRTRYTNMKGPKLYVEAMTQDKSLWCEEEHLDAKTHEVERIMMGMRLNEGLDSEGLDQKTVNRLESLGLITFLQADRIALTQKGRHLANQVITELIPS